MNGFLLWIGDAVAAALAVVGDGASWAWGTLDAIVGPVLSPVLLVLNPFANALGTILFDLLSFLPKWASLVMISSVLGVGMLFVFKYLSNQTAIARVKDDISANLLALKLYKDELRVTAITQVRLFWAVVRLQRYMLTPVLVTLPPMLLLLGQMGTYYQWDSLAVNEPTLLHVSIESHDGLPLNVSLTAPGSLRIDAGPIASQSDIVWRITPIEPGTYALTINVGEASFTKLATCGTRMERISVRRPGESWTNQLLHPIEPTIAPGTGIRAIDLDYAKAGSWFCGGDYWVVSLFAVSMIVALLLKSAVGVRF